VPPGISDATVPNPVFNLTPAATVDEGNNWINLSWGPLALGNPVTGVALSNYGPAAGSSVINRIPSTAAANFADAPALDFYGNSRKANLAVDAGAVEFAAGGGGGVTSATLTPTSFTFPGQTRNCPGTTLIQILGCLLDPLEVFTLTNTGTVPLTGVTGGTIGGADATEFALVPLFTSCGVAARGGTILAPGATCTVGVQFKPLTALTTGLKTATISVTDAAGTQTSTMSGTAN